MAKRGSGRKADGRTNEAKGAKAARLVFEIAMGAIMVGFMVFVGVYYGCLVWWMPH